MNEDAEFRQWLTTLADQNLAQAIRHRTRHVARGSLKEESGILLFSIGQPSLNGHFNGLLPLDPQISPAAVISQGQEFFAALNVGHTMRTHTRSLLSSLLPSAFRRTQDWRSSLQGRP